MPVSTAFQTSLMTWGFSTGTPSPARPTSWYASLHTGTPPTTGNELSGSGYARQSVGSLTVSGSAATNSGAVTFGAFTGTISGIAYSGLWDASTSGNLLAYGTLVQLGATYGAVAAGIASGGTATYAVGNTLTVVGGTGTAATLTVTAVSAGVITGVTVASAGAYTALPSNPVSITGGGGTGATFDLFYNQTASTYTVNNGDSLSFGIGQLSYSLGGQLIFNPS